MERLLTSLTLWRSPPLHFSPAGPKPLIMECILVGWFEARYEGKAIPLRR